MCLHVCVSLCVCHLCVGALGGQKNSLRMELWVVVSSWHRWWEPHLGLLKKYAFFTNVSSKCFVPWTHFIFQNLKMLSLEKVCEFLAYMCTEYTRVIFLIGFDKNHLLYCLSPNVSTKHYVKSLWIVETISLILKMNENTHTDHFGFINLSL